MDTLFQILMDASHTEFGKMHHFTDIHTLEEYQEEVPISGYDDYAAYIYRMYVKGEKDLLTPYPIIRWITFLGTMENPKRIPITERNEDPMAGFMEYLPLKGEKLPCTEEKLEENCLYQVVITNFSGLYRYLTRDIVVGRRDGNGKILPVFTYKADQIVDLANEHYTAPELENAVGQWAQKEHLSLIGMTMYQKEEPQNRSYVILLEVDGLDYGMDVEEAEKRLDKILSAENPAYTDARQRGKIDQCHIYFLQKGSFDRYKERKKSKGMTEEFINVPPIIHNEVTKRYFLSMIDECI